MKLRESMGFSTMSGIFLVMVSGRALSTRSTTWLPYTLSALVALSQRHCLRLISLPIT
jgi:hypothetical protein